MQFDINLNRKLNLYIVIPANNDIIIDGGMNSSVDKMHLTT